MRRQVTVAVVLCTGCPQTEQDACRQSFDYPREESAYDGGGSAQLALSERSIDVEVQTEEWAGSFAFPRAGETLALAPIERETVGQVVYQPAELGAQLELRDDSGALVLFAGNVSPLRADIPALLVGSTDAASGPCTSGSPDGKFTSLELRGVDAPELLAAGREVATTIEGVAFLAGAPWAFLSRDSSFEGWGYLLQTDVVD